MASENLSAPARPGKRVLTIRGIENAKPKPTRYELPDASLPSFYLSVMPSGHKSFVLRYRFAGKSRKLTIGPHPGGCAVRRSHSNHQVADRAQYHLSRETDRHSCPRKGSPLVMGRLPLQMGRCPAFSQAGRFAGSQRRRLCALQQPRRRLAPWVRFAGSPTF